MNGIVSWTAAYLNSQIHRSCFLTNVCRIIPSPFSPSGEKVADRPDEGAFVDGSELKRPPHPNPHPPIF
jgi:hypothetical protein